jgi:hypothetical protein
MSVKKIAIIQPNYIPWKGYFDIINMVDHFVLLDDVQYTARDWRNRNRIKTERGPLWLTIPVQVESSRTSLIKDIRIAESNWHRRHWKTICQHFHHARSFSENRDFFESLYAGCTSSFLLDVNYRIITAICSLLGIMTPISFSSSLSMRSEKSARLVDICRILGGSEYLSGPAAKEYIDESLFEKNDIKLAWMDYNGYPEYGQLYPPFDHRVSIIDLIFNEGPNARHYMKSFMTEKIPR